jgi:5-methyltetrahydrofolate--homocysteine methyltransferase
MTDTIISSASKEVVIGFGRPFAIIGERINPTGRRLLAEEMKAGDFSRVQADALAQVAAGAHVLDVNAGVPMADEPALMARAVRLVQSLTDLPLSIDSSMVSALEAGLEAYQGKALLNSVTGEEERLEHVLPLVKKYGAAVVAICNDDTGISMDINVRFEVARKIINRASDYGIPASDVVVDPLVMPIGAVAESGIQVLQLIHRLRTELKVNTTCGASNVSFGLPNRVGLNSAFISMAIGAGLTSAITNPMVDALMQAVRGADVMMNHDPQCMNWIAAYREPPKEGAAGGRRRRRSAQT